MPYGGYETYDFDVPVRNDADAYARYAIRLDEMRESMRIIEQCLERLEEPGPVMVEDPKVRWPAQLEVGPDGIGNSEAYVRHIMEESMEALIHHFKMVTQGVEVPPGEVYQAVESPRGELGFYVVSDGEHRPYRVKIRDPSFVNLQATPIMVEGHLIADAIAAIASIDPGDGGRGPLMPLFEDATLAEARTIIARYPAGRERSAVMPLLYLAQSIEGRVTRQGLQEVAALLGLTTAEVEAVASFYTMLRLQADRHARGVGVHEPVVRAPRLGPGVRGGAPGGRHPARRGALRRTASSRCTKRSASARARRRRWCRSTSCTTTTSRRSGWASSSGCCRRATFPLRRAARPMRDFRAASRLLAGLDPQEVDA